LASFASKLAQYDNDLYPTSQYIIIVVFYDFQKSADIAST